MVWQWCPAEKPRAVPSRWRSAGPHSISPLAVHLFLPVIPALKVALALSDAAAQFTFSIALLAMALATLAYGSLSDRLGRRPVLLGAGALPRGKCGLGGCADCACARPRPRGAGGGGRAAASRLCARSRVMLIAPMHLAAPSRI